MKNFDIICIGESLRDIFYFIDEASVSCSIEKDRCLLCLEYAEKIPVRSVIKVPAAGNSANAAVSSSRLGLKSALVSWVGQDFVGDQLKNHLREQKVDVSLLCKCQKQQTSEATLLSYKGERTQLLFFKPRFYKLPKLQKTNWIYYSAMGNKFEKFDKELVKYLNDNKKIKFSFQPGTTHVRKGLKHLKPLIKRSDVFILNKDEAQHILDGNIRPIKNLLEDFHKLGANIVVITDGKQGAYANEGKNFWHMPIFKGDAKERTGAGDAFAAAFTVAIMQNKKIPEALRWGTANSWSVVREVGPQKGLLTKSQMQTILKRFKTKANQI
ncbi:MAG: carbohydrate kinase family protein [Patescibacteria group bacterium]|nr:carbohydrate kinase family protein [Patescibacteria group bacterium]